MYMNGIQLHAPIRQIPQRRAGLGAWDDDSESWGDYDVVTQAAPYTPPSASSNFDWSGLLNTAVNAWGKIETLNAQKEIAVAQRTYIPPKPANRYALPPGYGYNSAPGLTPFPGQYSGGTMFGMSTTTILLLGGVGVAAFFLLKD